MEPVARYLIMCEEVLADPANPQRITLVNLISTIRSLADPPFPVRHGEMCAFVQLSGCRGVVTSRLDVVHAETEEVLFQTQTRQLPLPNDPLEIVGFAFRLQNLLFPEPGLYEVRFLCNDKVLARQPLLLR